MHDEDLSDVFSRSTAVGFLVERQGDADAVRIITRSSKDRFMTVIRGDFCFE